MDHDDHEEHEEEVEDGHEDDNKRHHDLPLDLPRSLDDRRGYQSYGFGDETEMYDAWQGARLDPIPRCHVH